MTGDDVVRNALFGIAWRGLRRGAGDGCGKAAGHHVARPAVEVGGDGPRLSTFGVVLPADFALHVRRYLHESPATREHMAMVAMKDHRHGLRTLSWFRDQDGAGRLDGPRSFAVKP